jgi:hypothetical protein
VFNAEHFAGSCDAGLDFIGDEQDIVFCAELTDFGEVIVIWDDNSTMSGQCLDGNTQPRLELVQ